MPLVVSRRGKVEPMAGSFMKLTFWLLRVHIDLQQSRYLANVNIIQTGSVHSVKGPQSSIVALS